MTMWRWFVLCVCLVLSSVGSVLAMEGFIGITNGYFYNQSTGKAWLPHGVAYQTWNRPLGVWQTEEQIEYDLDEMVKMGANSVRIDIVWQHAEELGDNQFSWDNYDFFIDACEQRDLRIFALVGYQWPPNWFPDEWYTQHPPEMDASGIIHTQRWQSDIINYEHPDARAQYAEWIGAVCGRYKDEKAMAGWIVGNEYGYLGLWSGLLDGYDPEAEASFREWLEDKYVLIEAANDAWGTDYGSFESIDFIDAYTAYGPEGAVWADTVQFREDSIAEFTALSAAAAKGANTNHLISYSTVGMQWGEEDWRYHAEDRGKITTACEAIGAPLDFFSVNNYPWSVLGHESQQGHWGVSFTKKVARMPVLYTETGFSSSETMWPGMNEARQAPLIRNALWGGLEAGAVGTHVFSWMDRPYITVREKGFGIVYADRNIKPAYWETRDTYNLMEQVGLADKLMASEDPTPDIAFLMTGAVDSQYNRFECEMQQLAGALERLGYEPNFMDLNDLATGVYSNYQVLILPRNMRVTERVPGTSQTVLEYINTAVIGAGVHVLADADIPGVQSQLGIARPEYVAEVNALFGVDASDPGGYEARMITKSYISAYWNLIEVDFNSNAMGAVTNDYHYWPQIWKYSDEIEVTDGTVWATMDTLRNKGFEESTTSVQRWNLWTNSGALEIVQYGWEFEGNNMVQMYGDVGMWQDFPANSGGRYTASAYLRNNHDDALRNGKNAYVAIEWYDKEDVLLSISESPHLTTNTPDDVWVKYTVDAFAPAGAYIGRRKIVIEGPGDGSVFVDNYQRAPAIVVKDHTAAKSAIILYSAGDIKPDSDFDGNPDVAAWKWRYDVVGAIIRDYFGVEPSVRVLGENAYLCLPEYRTLSDGSTLWQIKNYQYDTNFSNGGPDLTFTMTSTLFQAKTVEGWLSGRVIEANSDGTIEVTLPPDGMEMLHVYDTVLTTQICNLVDAPAAIHPMGDKAYLTKVEYDTLGLSDVVLNIAFMEADDNGDGVSNEIYQLMSTQVVNSGTSSNWVWIPEPDKGDADYISTPEGGRYVFKAWLEDLSGNILVESVPQRSDLFWGIAMTNPIPTNVSKGDSVAFNLKWEMLNEQLGWQNTPLERETAFANRIAVFRSLKTEALYPGHLDRVNRVADWLESLGYANGNPLDISFDNFSVSGGLLTDDFSDGNYDGWSREAGAGNWRVDDEALHAWRIGNDDNIMVTGNLNWSNYTVETDFIYNTAGPYFNDAEILLRYQDRDNFVKVGVQNFYSFWKIKYTIREDANNLEQGWLVSFSKTNSPTTNVWYNFKVEASNETFTVYLDDELMGSFDVTNFPSGKVGLATRAVQLGIWEPAKGYYFVDDDEYSYYAGPDASTTQGSPMELSWGYLVGFFPTLILPGTYAMSDTEIENIATWLPGGMNSLIVLDGGAGMVDENGVAKPGRLEPWLGVTSGSKNIAGITNMMVNDSSHYVMHDLETGDDIPFAVTANAYTSLVSGVALATLQDGSDLPAFVVNTVTNNAEAPAKTICFNFDIDSDGKLTNELAVAAQRAFEWARGQAYKVMLQLKYPTPLNNVDLDLVLLETEGWIISGSGEDTLMVDIPEDGIMTGDNLYWTMYVYPWQAEDGWIEHTGFYVTSNDDTNGPGMRTSIAGQGLQLLGGAQRAYAGRAWDMFVAYNTRGESLTVRHGLKKKGLEDDEDNFASGTTSGWTIDANADISWGVVGEALRATVVGGLDASDIKRTSCNVSNRSITLEYDVRFMNGASSGGVLYRGQLFEANPSRIGWADDSSFYYSGSPFTAGAWHHVILSIRPGSNTMTSDLIIDGDVIFLHEPMEFSSWPESAIGFRSPTSTGYVEWDNFRLAEEEYSYVTEVSPISGESIPTSMVPTFYFNAPDFDPDLLGYVSTSKGGEYEWYIHAPGKDLHSAIDAEIYEGPRLMVEDASFPTNMDQGCLVQVPVAWECMTETGQVPALLTIKLENPYAGETYLTETFIITNSSGTQLFDIVVPTNIPASPNYLWVSYISPTNALDPWLERMGADETFRFDLQGVAVECETGVRVSSVDGNNLIAYGDIGRVIGSERFQWGGGAYSVDDTYTGGTPPEGVTSVQTLNYSSYAGWGMFMENNGTIDLSSYAGGNIRFWLLSTKTTKVEVEAPKGRKATKSIPSTGGVWQEIVIPINSLSGISLSRVYGLFMASIESTGNFYVDYVRWERDPASNLAPSINLPGPHVLLVGATTNFFVTASDPESRPTTLTNSVAPAGATFNVSIFSWTAPASGAGTTNVITFVADDQQGQANSVVTNSTEIIVPWDGDADGLGDDWEWTSFTTLIYSGADDNDGDGAVNSNEYAAGTSASDPDSVFEASIESNYSTTGDFSIQVSTIPGKQYTIYYSDDSLKGPMTWLPFANGDNGVGTWIETNAVAGLFTFVDDMGPDTTGSDPVNGFRTFKIKVGNP